MAFSKASREKAAATRAANKLAREAAAGSGTVAKVASVKHTGPKDLATLLATIENLKAQLGVSEKARSEAEQRALELAEAQGGIMLPDVQEVPTGRFVNARRLDPKAPYKEVGYKEDGRPILKPQFITVKIPTFFYKVDIPLCGEKGLKINGTEFYHGTVYEFDRDTLSTVKEMVFRLWDHDRNIHGNNENAYRYRQRDVNPKNNISGLRR